MHLMYDPDLLLSQITCMLLSLFQSLIFELQVKKEKYDQDPLVGKLETICIGLNQMDWRICIGEMSFGGYECMFCKNKFQETIRKERNYYVKFSYILTYVKNPKFTVINFGNLFCFLFFTSPHCFPFLKQKIRCRDIQSYISLCICNG